MKLKRGDLSLVVKTLIVLSVVIVGVTCASEKETTKGTVQGTIYVIGNEPFTSFALEDPQGRMLRLSISKEIRQQLLGLQGKKVEVQYSKIDTTAEGITLSVDKFRQVPP